MPEDDVSARLRAVERALTDGEEIPDLSAAADAERRLDALESEVATLAERVDALDATVQSLHGYVGDLEHVNDRVERRADAARAAVERLEGRRTPPETSDGRGDVDHPSAASTSDASTAETATSDASTSRASFRGDGDEAEESLFGRVRDAL